MTAILYLLAPFITKRLGNSIVLYMFTLCFLTMVGTYIQSWQEQTNYTQLLEEGNDDDGLEVSVKPPYVFFLQTNLFFTSFACPSKKMLLSYIVLFISFVTVFTLHKGDLEDATTRKALASIPAYLMTIVLIFHLQQSRQLKRFFK